jgi:hypothetical protein
MESIGDNIERDICTAWILAPNLCLSDIAAEKNHEADRLKNHDV